MALRGAEQCCAQIKDDVLCNFNKKKHQMVSFVVHLRTQDSTLEHEPCEPANQAPVWASARGANARRGQPGKQPMIWTSNESEGQVKNNTIATQTHNFTSEAKETT